MSAAPAATAPTPFAQLAVPAGGGPYFDLGDHRGWGKVGSSQSGGAFLMAEVESDPNGGVPLHSHEHEDETFFVLSGRFAVTIGDIQTDAKPGDTAFAPRNIPHAWRCVGEEPGRLLVVITPGANFEAYATEMAARQIAPSRAVTDPAVASELRAISARYGMTFHAANS